MALFQPGQSGNPGGKPKGTKNLDRLNYLDLQIWFKKMYETLEDIDKPGERMMFQLQIADKLLAKIQNLPSSPEESANNARARQEMMAALEADPKPVDPQQPLPAQENGNAPA